MFLFFFRKLPDFWARDAPGTLPGRSRDTFRRNFGDCLEKTQKNVKKTLKDQLFSKNFIQKTILNKPAIDDRAVIFISSLPLELA